MKQAVMIAENKTVYLKESAEKLLEIITGQGG